MVDNPDDVSKDLEIYKVVDQLIVESKCTKSYRLKNVPGYCRRNDKFTNEIEALEQKLQAYAFTGHEAEEQPFIYH